LSEITQNARRHGDQEGRYLKNEPSTYQSTENARRDVNQEGRYQKHGTYVLAVDLFKIAMDLLVDAEQLSPWIRVMRSRVSSVLLLVAAADAPTPQTNRVWIGVS